MWILHIVRAEEYNSNRSDSSEIYVDATKQQLSAEMDELEGLIVQLISQLDSDYIAKIVEYTDSEIYMEYIEKDRSTIDWITRDIERMIDCYLAEKGRNYLLMSRDEEKNNENVIGIAYRMKQMTKSIERMKKREVTDRE